MGPEEGVAATAGADARQRQIYGESWSDRLQRLLRSYRISQARLAAVVGLSAPMVSQLMSGQRVKISNPAVYGRIMRLEELADQPGVQAGDPTALAAILDDVAASHPVLTTREVIASPAGTRGALVTGLAAQGTRDGLRAAARAASDAGDVALASLLQDAAEM